MPNAKGALGSQYSALSPCNVPQNGSRVVSSKTPHCLKYGFIAAAMNVCLKARDSQANR